MYEIKLEDAKGKLLALFNAAIKGERVFIFKDEKQAVQLVPVPHPERHPRFGSAKGLIEMTDDFDLPLEDFQEFMP